MAKRNNNAWLKRFIAEKSLTRVDVARSCEVGISTVDRWLVPPRKVSRRNMPNMAVKVLMLMDELGQFEKKTD